MKINLPKTKEIEFTPSHYQQAIKEFVIDQGLPENIIVEGVAGCGKTSTLRWLGRQLPKKKRAILVCFNKHIAEEASRVLPANIEARTCHSLGNSVFGGFAWHAVGAYKDDNIFKRLLNYDKASQEVKKFYWDEKNFILPIISKLKNAGFPPVPLKKDGVSTEEYTKDFLEIVDEICQNHRIDCTAQHIPYVKEVWKESCRWRPERPKGKTINYDDMLYFPVTMDLEFPTYDIILVDEGQDLNKLNRLFIRKMCHEQTRIIVVGDPDQSIYGFRGADPESMQEFQSEYGCKNLPLSISYRCGDGIIREAQKIVPRIEGNENPGSVFSIPDSEIFTLTEPGDFILCRITAPLVALCLQFLSQGIPASVIGRDLIKGIIKLAKDCEKATEFSPSGITHHCQQICDRLTREKKKWEAEIVFDKMNILLAFAQNPNISSVRDLEEWVDNVFKDELSKGITLSTVHRVKGLEADRVFIIKPELMPWPKAQLAWEIKQEMNIKYVAITRAKKELYYVETTE